MNVEIQASKSGPDQKRPMKLHALTSLRFFAALYVVLYHTLGSALPWLVQSTTGTRVLSLGYLSVSFFYLLSGYILGMVYLGGGKSVPKKNFYIARFARIYPLFFLTLLADAPNLLLTRAANYGWLTAIGETSVTFVGNMLM